MNRRTFSRKLRLQLPLALIVFGMIVRLVRYLENPSLWGDEAALALNILGRSALGLLKPLDYSQAAPPAFLLLEKAAVALFGGSEFSLRLVPLMAALASVPLFYTVAVRLLGRRDALPALTLFILSEPLIFYAVQVKQYSVEVLVCLVIVASALEPARLGASAKNVWRLLVAGTCGMLLSFSAVFVCAGMGLLLAVGGLRRRSARELAVISLVSALWAVVFGAFYVGSYGRVKEISFLVDYWKGFYLGGLPWSLADVKWGLTAFLRYFRDPLYLGWVPVAASVFLCGVIRLLLIKGRAFAVVISPLCFVFIAQVCRLMPVPSGSVEVSAAVVYPFNGRLVLFTVPLAILILASGLGSLLLAGRRRLVCMGAATVALLLSGMLYQTAWTLLSNPKIQEMRPLLRRIAEKSARGDLYFVLSYGGVVVDYYALRQGVSFEAKPVAFRTASDAAVLSGLIGQMRKGQRFWLITLYHPTWRNEKERQHVLRFLGGSADKALMLSEYGATADLLVKR